MTLYTYVPSKEELLDVMVDQEQLEQVTGQSNDAWWNEHPGRRTTRSGVAARSGWRRPRERARDL
jgi:hypothetical protein